MALAGVIAGLLIVFVAGAIGVSYTLITRRRAIGRLAHSLVDRFARSRALAWSRRRWPSAWRPAERLAEWAAELGAATLIGMGFSIGGLALFAHIAQETRAVDEPLVAFDNRLAQTLHDAAGEPTLAAMRAVSFVGSVRVLACVGFAVALSLALLRRWALLTMWAAALIGAGALNQLLKNLFRRERPPFASPADYPDPWSFPSGHSMVSLVAFGALAYILIVLISTPQRPAARRKAAAIGAASGLAALIGISRMTLGVHYFSDVAGGFAAGAAWLAACITWAEVQRARAD